MGSAQSSLFPRLESHYAKKKCLHDSGLVIIATSNEKLGEVLVIQGHPEEITYPPKSLIVHQSFVVGLSRAVLAVFFHFSNTLTSVGIISSGMV